jgi:glycerophosphoryl diester phosphodiesterase
VTARGAAARPASPPLPPVIGHRGAAAYAPENTLAAFRIAERLGCRWVEFDVRLTADDALVVCHDDRLERTTGGRGAISKAPLAAIRELDAGSWFGPDFADERVPTLDETLAACLELRLGANIEIKAARGRGVVTAGAVAAALARLGARLPPVLVSSFLPSAVAEMAARTPSIPRAVLYRKVPNNWAATALRLGCATVNADQAYLSEPIAAAIRVAGLPLLAYTVNDPARARQLFRWGVTSVFSDAPDIISAAAASEFGNGARRGATT